MITIYMTEKIDVYDKLIEKYETLSNSDPSSDDYQVGLAELWEMSDPKMLLKKTIIDKLGDLPCDKLEKYEKFFGGPIQTGDIMYPLPEASTTQCRHGRDCYRKGNLLHTVEYTHKGITPRHHTQALFDTLHEIKQKRHHMCVTVRGMGKKMKNSKKKKTTKKKRKRSNTKKKRRKKKRQTKNIK